MWKLLADKIRKSGKNAILLLCRLYSEIYCIEGEFLDNRELFSCWCRAVQLQQASQQPCARDGQ